MLHSYAQLRRLVGGPHTLPARLSPAKVTASPASLEPADILDGWQLARTPTPPFMCESTGLRRPLRQPVLVTPSGHSMSQADAQYMGLSHLPNRILRRAMERLVAGEADWDEAVCPITLDSFYQPVQIASPFIDAQTGALHIEDHAYELVAIEEWFMACGQISVSLQGAVPSSPMTRAQLRYPIVLVANLAVADMCRARRGQPPLTEDQARFVRRACREASAALNQGERDANNASHLIRCIFLGGVGLALGIEVYASHIDITVHAPWPLYQPPARNDTAFWQACLDLEVAGPPSEWPWTPDAARHGCAAIDAACRIGTRELIEEVCADAVFATHSHAPWVPPRISENAESLRCGFLHNACNVGGYYYLASPDYVRPGPYATPTEIWPYHAGAIAVLMASALGIFAVYTCSRRRRHSRAASPV